jgi:hypothetical protein
MDRTTLNLLTRDGALAVSFTPALTPAQYGELYEIACDYDDTAEAMAAAVKEAAARWGIKVAIDLPLTAEPLVTEARLTATKPVRQPPRHSRS